LKLRPQCLLTRSAPGQRWHEPRHEPCHC
jgi:hypothetical protein